MVKSSLWAAALGVLTVFTTTGFAGDEIAANPYSRPCPPGYRPVYPGRAMPGRAMPPRADHPSDLPMDDDPSKPAVDPGNPPADNAPPNLPAQPNVPNLGNLPSPSGPGPGLAGLGGGAQTPMLGRIDSSNRMNLFDNMTAIPASRVWVAYLRGQGQNPNVISTGNANVGLLTPAQQATGAQLLNRTDVNAYRIGAEIAITEDFSLSAQGQYVDTFDNTAYQSDWTNPQFMAKYVLYRDCDCGLQTVVSGTLGFQWEVSTDAGTINDSTSRVYPGLLFYKDHSEDVFSQGGVQVGIPIGQDPTTFDWSYSLGYWAYRAGTDCDAGCEIGCDGRYKEPFLRGVAPQIGVLGKHVWGDNDYADPFGISAVPVMQPDPDFMGPGMAPLVPVQGGAQQFVSYEESRHIIDVTAGATILFRHDIAMGVGYSFPVTGGNARDGEFLASLNWYF